MIEGHTTHVREDIESALQNPVPAPRSTPSTLQIENAIEGNATGTASMRDLLVEAGRTSKSKKKLMLPIWLATRRNQPLHSTSSGFTGSFMPMPHQTCSLFLGVARNSGLSRVIGERIRKKMSLSVSTFRQRRCCGFMSYFESQYNLREGLERCRKFLRYSCCPSQIQLRFTHSRTAMAGVSRLMSHAMGHAAGIGAHGLWSVSRGLARGLESRSDYKRMMDHADMPRQGDLDGRGNLSLRALVAFSEWFLRSASTRSDLWRICSNWKPLPPDW
ncbi:MAG: hypothetical protein U1E15_03475 [Hyphomicrobiales bacterium]